MKYCNKCGAELKDDAMFCKKCGNKYEEKNKLEISDTETVKESNETSINTTKTKQYNKENKTVPATVTIILTILCIGLAGLSIYEISQVQIDNEKIYELDAENYDLRVENSQLAMENYDLSSNYDEIIKFSQEKNIGEFTNQFKATPVILSVKEGETKYIKLITGMGSSFGVYTDYDSPGKVVADFTEDSWNGSTTIKITGVTKGLSVVRFTSDSKGKPEISILAIVTE